MSAETTCAAELKYLESTAALDLLCKEEDLRRGRLRSLLLSDELDQSNDKLFLEAERADLAEYDVQYWQDLADEYQRHVERDEGEARTRMRELENLKAELASLHSVSADSNSLLAEKLALSRDLATMKPELEHLRSQVASNERLFAEKLSLQHDLSICKAELEEARRILQRLRAKQGQSSETDMQLESEIKQLRIELDKERRERERAEKTATEGAEGLRQELATEKREREKADKAASKPGPESDELVDLKKELAAEKRERAKAEKLAAKSTANWEAQKAVLEDKLDQFRTKLRSTKESLRETQEALEQAQQGTIDLQPAPASRTSRKRSAAQMDPDAAIGTPGDAAPNKRSRRATSIVLGEKSTFSITPFLNRATSIAPESPKNDQAGDGEEPVPSIEPAASPTAHLTQATKKATASKKASPLAPASLGKNNVKVAASKPVPRKKAGSAFTLEKVIEEGPTGGNAGDENSGNTTSEQAPSAHTSTEAPKNAKLARLSLKPKSLSSFATFRDGSLPPQQLQKKKRKLLGGAKTLFDDDEEGDADGDAGELGAIKGGAPSLGGQRAFGAFGGAKGFGGLGLLGGAKKKGPLVVAKDGFMFSPLKKDRKALAAAAAAATQVAGRA